MKTPKNKTLQKTYKIQTHIIRKILTQKERTTAGTDQNAEVLSLLYI